MTQHECDRCGTAIAGVTLTLPDGWAMIAVTTNAEVDGFTVCADCAAFLTRELQGGGRESQEITRTVDVRSRTAAPAPDDKGET